MVVFPSTSFKSSIGITDQKNSDHCGFTYFDINSFFDELQVLAKFL
jgi:hypothetical protein